MKTVVRRSGYTVNEMLRKYYPKHSISLIDSNPEEFVSEYVLRKKTGRKIEEVKIQLQQVSEYKFKIIELNG